MSCVWTWEIIAIKWMFSPEAFKKQLNKFIALLLLVDDCVWPLVLFSSSFFFLFHNIPHNTCSLVFNPSLHTLLFSFAPFPVKRHRSEARIKVKNHESHEEYIQVLLVFFIYDCLFSHSIQKVSVPKGEGNQKRIYPWEENHALQWKTWWWESWWWLPSLLTGLPSDRITW